MKRANDLVVKGASAKGNATSDRYSLKGFGDALDRVQKDAAEAARPLRKVCEGSKQRFATCCARYRIAFHSPRIKSGVRCRLPGKGC